MRLGGWLRLWIVLVVLYGIAVTGVTVMLFPHERDLVASWTSATLDFIASDIARVSGRSYSKWDLRHHKDFEGKTDEDIALEMTARAKDIDLANHTDLAAYKQEILFLEHQHRQKVAALPQDQAKAIGLALAAWAVPAIALLALGYVAGWVYRGFKGA